MLFWVTACFPSPFFFFFFLPACLTAPSPHWRFNHPLLIVNAAAGTSSNEPLQQAESLTTHQQPRLFLQVTGHQRASDSWCASKIQQILPCLAFVAPTSSALWSFFLYYGVFGSSGSPTRLDIIRRKLLSFLPLSLVYLFSSLFLPCSRSSAQTQTLTCPDSSRSRVRQYIKIRTIFNLSG